MDNEQVHTRRSFKGTQMKNHNFLEDFEDGKKPMISWRAFQTMSKKPNGTSKKKRRRKRKGNGQKK